jgi:alkanesulfonate monooxygenase SsuD/methylene tetrahydromethanopterin reductase-like flavin-dependent oxidoreductase (luciferase family)
VAPRECDPKVAADSLAASMALARRADELGFDWVSVSEHHSSPLILTPSVAPLAGALTQIVRRARIALLGPLAPVNNPVRVAEEIAILDQLSHGRLVVLPLRGSPGEFNTYGPIEALQTQPMTQEATRLIRKALSETEPFAWDGQHYHFPRVGVWPRPIQQPPPLYFSGNSVSSAVFAAREGLGVCLSFHPTEVVADTVSKYLAEAAATGWQPTPEHIVYRSFLVVADTPERAEELEAVFLAPGLRFLLNGPSPGPEATAHAAPSGSRRMLFAGTPDTVVERIQAFQAATGVGVLDLIVSGGQFPAADVRRSIELFGREVLPRIRELTPARQPTPAGASSGS